MKPLLEDVRQNDFLLRFRIGLMKDRLCRRRAILKGTKTPPWARSLYAGTSAPDPSFLFHSEIVI